MARCNWFAKESNNLFATEKTIKCSYVARIKRSAIRGIGAKAFPDCAALNPGYDTVFSVALVLIFLASLREK
jgi:hypothetical protein